MRNLRPQSGRTNNRMTSRVIELHEKGYNMDFLLSEQQDFLCIQDSSSFEKDELYIMVIDQIFDHFSKTIKYIHTVETPTGEKGILLCDRVCTNRSYNTQNFALFR